MAQREFSSDVCQWVTSGLAGQSRASGQSCIHLDDEILKETDYARAMKMSVKWPHQHLLLHFDRQWCNDFFLGEKMNCITALTIVVLVVGNKY